MKGKKKKSSYSDNCIDNKLLVLFCEFEKLKLLTAGIVDYKTSKKLGIA